MLWVIFILFVFSQMLTQQYAVEAFSYALDPGMSLLGGELQLQFLILLLSKPGIDLETVWVSGQNKAHVLFMSHTF